MNVVAPGGWWLALALLATGGCRCGSRLEPVAPAELAVDPARLNFEATFVGTTARRTLDVTNQGGAEAAIDLGVSGPFAADRAHLDLPRGARATIAITFAPDAGGPVSGVLAVGAVEVPLTGTGVVVPECVAAAACTTSSFDPTAGTCVVARASDGTACHTRCLRGACSAGTCIGAPVSCDDGDACTTDACSEDTGCEHLPRTCPAPKAASCTVATCDPASGCGATAAPDGTVCGADDCGAFTVDVCVAGQCVTRPRPATGQCTNRWVPSSITTRSGHAMVFDPARQTVVLFGGWGARSGGTLDETWEWNGTTWTQRFPATSAAPSRNHAMAYDSFRRRAVLFGGMLDSSSATSLLGGANGTFEWDGQVWVYRASAVAPPLLTEGAMAFDASRRRAVLFGGSGWSACLDETWEWDGQAWAQVTDGGAPGPRRSHALSYDSARRQVVLFGGLDDTRAALGDTWTWDGQTWSRIATPRSPSARSGHAMAFDERRQRLVLFGGQLDGGTPLSDTWEWDGQTWTEKTPAIAPGSRQRAAMAYDGTRGEIILFGGSSSSGSEALLSDIWAWDGTTWSPRGPPPPPPPRSDFDLTYDDATRTIVLFGGVAAVPWGTSAPWLDDTWEWDGVAWHLRSPATSPPPHRNHRMAYDRLRQRVVLAGGDVLDAGAANGTWEWDGVAWSLAPASSAPAGGAAAMTWDPTQQRTLMVTSFGTSGSPSAGTWTWDGAAWVHVAPSSPLPGGGWGMTFDAARQNVVAVAVPYSGYPAETWVWQAGAWTQRATTTPPFLRGVCGLAHDPARQRVLLFGFDETLIWTSHPQTWEWDGTDWTQRQPVTTPFPGGLFPGNQTCALAYDAARQRVTLFDGFNTWRWVP